MGLALALLLAAPAARADGAFPDELQIFAPAAFPHRLVLGTNFGVVLSEDDGQSWRFVCESYLSGGTFAYGYQQGPEGDLYALAGPGLVRSGDLGCTWTATPAPGGAAGVRDAFPDPAVPGRVAALTPAVAGGPRSALYVSTDGARSFGAPLDTSADQDWAGVEFAASAPGRLYVTGDVYPPDAGDKLPVVRALEDGGWSESVHAPYARDLALLAGVDPRDPDALWLRLVAPDNRDLLAFSPDRGRTLTTALEPGASLSAFALGGDGTVWAGTRSGVLYRRGPGEATFTQLAGPHLRCLAERAGLLYACGDPLADGYALAVSADRGQSFRPLLRFGEIQGPLACLGGACDADFARLLQAFPPDAGPAVDAGPAPTPAPAPKGCGCGEGGGALGLAGLLVLAGRRRH